MWLDQISPRLNALWRGPWKPFYIEPARSLYDHELVMVLDGEFRLRIGGREWDMRKGWFVVVPPGTVHVSFGGPRPVIRACVHFDWIPEKVPARPICCYHPRRPSRRLVLPAPAFVQVPGRPRPFEAAGPISALLETLFFQWQAGDRFHRALARTTFQDILLRLLWPGSRRRAAPSRVAGPAYAVKEILDAGDVPAGGLRARLASRGQSYGHLSRLFRRQFGLTPGEYLTAQRLEKAKILLRNSGTTVAEAAYAAGFHDPGYFARCFRRQNGISPREFRGS